MTDVAPGSNSESEHSESPHQPESYNHQWDGSSGWDSTQSDHPHWPFESDPDPEVFWTEVNDDPQHEYYGCTCFYGTEDAIEDIDYQTANVDQAYNVVFMSYLQARDALTHARVARGFYLVVGPAGFAPNPKV